MVLVRVWGSVSDEETERIDAAVALLGMKNRSQFVYAAVIEKLDLLEVQEEGAAPPLKVCDTETEECAREQQLDEEILRLSNALQNAQLNEKIAQAKLQLAQEHEKQLLDLLYQEKGEKRVLLEKFPQLPPPKVSFWDKIFGGRREE